MKRLFIILALASNIQCSGQSLTSHSENNFFLLDKIPLEDIKALEANFISKNEPSKTPIFLSQDFFADTDKLSPYPLIYIRQDKTFKPSTEVNVSYYFNESDSTLQLVTYTWDAQKTGTPLQDMKAQKVGNFKEYEKKYELIKGQFTNILGNPLRSDPKAIEAKDKDYGTWVEKSSIWSTTQTTIELKMVYTENREYNTQRIRVKISYLT